ncbi:hypothetical protein [Planktothricoides sp. SR001]|nr:hypothetical protein [Planktothricoides sp. SR001]
MTVFLLMGSVVHLFLPVYLPDFFHVLANMLRRSHFCHDFELITILSNSM